ncbi:MAG: tetratricopeptide repeat protein, partial [Cyanobacteria bacterium]|nr:tetratricopeptide repeat protein [Cyanobacteriota bacterium]MDW8202478.1 tetratricopeptide repeat protein [Cyanobacteriota bacterium SKYGB_h_bin112]
SEAIAQYEKAVQHDAKFWPALNNIGLIRYEQGDVEGAMRHWRESIAIDDKQAEPQLALAVALYAKGDRTQGLLLGEQALRLDKRYADLEFLKENLWGDRLLAEAKKFLSVPQIKAVLAQTGSSP